MSTKTSKPATKSTQTITPIDEHERLTLGLHAAIQEQTRAAGRTVRALLELDNARAYREAGCESIWEFCTEYAEMDPLDASYRLDAMDVARRCPKLLDAMECGVLQEWKVALLRHRVDEKNVDELIEKCADLTETEMKQLLDIDDWAEALGWPEVMIDPEMRISIEECRDILRERGPEVTPTEVVKRALGALIAQLNRRN